MEAVADNISIHGVSWKKDNHVTADEVNIASAERWPGQQVAIHDTCLQQPNPLWQDLTNKQLFKERKRERMRWKPRIGNWK